MNLLLQTQSSPTIKSPFPVYNRSGKKNGIEMEEILVLLSC